MAYNQKKFLDSAGTSYLWSKIKAALNEKADANSLSTVATSGAAADVTITDAGNHFEATTVEGALQEIGTAIQTAGAVSVTESEGSGATLKTYTLAQNGQTIGTINIPKDMVALSGEITNSDGTNEGTFLKLNIANGDPIYVNVANLIEYNSVADSDELDFTDTNHQISATIKTGSIAKSKLATAVQTSLTAADTALQAADITSGTTNGTISVDGTEVAVAGLGSAAYTDSTAYATAAQGTLAASALQEADISTGSSNGQITVGSKQVSVYGLGTAAYANTSAFDASGEAQAAYDAIIALTTTEIDTAIANAASGS